MNSLLYAIFAALLIVQTLCASIPQSSDADSEAQALLNRRLSALRQFESFRELSNLDRDLVKRNPHQIEVRALNQFKNCYFSPIQCVLMERRRR